MMKGRTDLTTAKATRAAALHIDVPLPALITAAGETATRRYLEFFAAQIRNPNTRAAYYRASAEFFAWCDTVGLDLIDIEPLHVAAYIEVLGERYAKPTVKQRLAAIRMVFDWLVTGHIVQLNPATAVRGPKHVTKKGKTPVLSADEARELLDSIDTTTVVGLRDRALIAVMTYSFARVGAVVAMNVDDYFAQGKRYWVRLHEKGGKRHDVPAHHALEQYIDDYMAGAGIVPSRTLPLFRSARGRSGELTERRMNRVDVYRMIGRRVRAAGLTTRANCHTFRATGITAYLDNGGLLEHAQTIANHESPRTTKLYDRTSDDIALDEIERIHI